jgi:hypothetical protein
LWVLTLFVFLVLGVVSLGWSGDNGWLNLSGTPVTRWQGLGFAFISLLGLLGVGTVGGWLVGLLWRSILGGVHARIGNLNQTEEAGTLVAGLQRFTDRARKVMQLANQEAQRFNHEYIGTEHILLGLVKEGSGVAANVLKNLDIDLRKIRLEVEKIVQSGPDMVTMGNLPQPPRAKKVIEYSIEEASNLNHNYVGTEHLLLGLLRDQGGVAYQILNNFGLTVEYLRTVIQALPRPAGNSGQANGP